MTGKQSGVARIGRAEALTHQAKLAVRSLGPFFRAIKKSLHSLPRLIGYRRPRTPPRDALNDFIGNRKIAFCTKTRKSCSFAKWQGNSIGFTVTWTINSTAWRDFSPFARQCVDGIAYPVKRDRRIWRQNRQLVVALFMGASTLTTTEAAAYRRCWARRRLRLLRAYGVVVPDLPGCTSAGSTTDEALRNAVEAVRLWVEDAIDDGEVLPPPRTSPSVEALRADPEIAAALTEGAALAMVPTAS